MFRSNRCAAARWTERLAVLSTSLRGRHEASEQEKGQTAQAHDSPSTAVLSRRYARRADAPSIASEAGLDT